MKRMFTIAIGLICLFLSPNLTFANMPMPVDLINFEASASGAHVVVLWTTQTETDCDYYQIQKSRDQIVWFDVATVDGAGNSNDILNYSYLDTEAFPAESYYRLIQFDGNGDFYVLSSDFTNLISLDELEVFPNPANEELFLQAEGDISDLEIQITDLAGNEVFVETISLGNRTRLNTTSLKNGIYILRSTFGKSVSSKRIVISHNR